MAPMINHYKIDYQLKMKLQIFKNHLIDINVRQLHIKINK